MLCLNLIWNRIQIIYQRKKKYLSSFIHKNSNEILVLQMRGVLVLMLIILLRVFMKYLTTTYDKLMQLVDDTNNANQLSCGIYLDGEKIVVIKSNFTDMIKGGTTTK